LIVYMLCACVRCADLRCCLYSLQICCMSIRAYRDFIAVRTNGQEVYQRIAQSANQQRHIEPCVYQTHDRVLLVPLHNWVIHARLDRVARQAQKEAAQNQRHQQVLQRIRNRCSQQVCKQLC